MINQNTIEKVNGSLKDNSLVSNARAYASINDTINNFIDNKNISGPAWNLIKESLKVYGSAIEDLNDTGNKLSSTLSTLSTMLDNLSIYMNEVKVSNVDLNSKEELEKQISKLNEQINELELKRSNPYIRRFNEDSGAYEYTYDSTILANCNARIEIYKKLIYELEQKVKIIVKINDYIEEINRKVIQSGINELISNLEKKYSNI